MSELYSNLFKEILKSYYNKNFEAKVGEILSRPDVDKEKLSRIISSLCGVTLHYSNNYIDDLKKAIENYNPKHKVVNKIQDCSMNCQTKDGETNCQKSCPFDAIFINKLKNTTEIDPEKCTDCGYCIENCPSHSIVDVVEFVPFIKSFDEKQNIIAAVAPSIIGQFGDTTSINQLRAALKKVGFDDMIEVAFFADMLTLKEAMEFDEHIDSDKDFLLSSCCCPVWVGMIRNIYDNLIQNISPSVSPMIASGRAIKKLNPNCKVVFIGPCVAKKSEAKNSDLLGDIDGVLTFLELRDIFEALDINPSELEEDLSHDYASREGRLYGRIGGVSTAVGEAVKRICSNKFHLFSSFQANGVMECKKMLDNALKGEIDARFLEGMGCVGGCIGGPKTIVPKDIGVKLLDEFAENSNVKISLENPSMKTFLSRLGINDVDLPDSKKKLEIFERDFNQE